MSPVLSQADEEALRAIQADNFPHRCRLESLEEGPLLPSGGRESIWVPYAQNVPCRLTPLTGTELPRGIVLTPETNYRLVLPYGRAVAAQDRAIVTGTTNGIGWETTLGFTFIETPKAPQSATYTYGTDRVDQVGESLG